jgi:uncharacterized protein involved in type VI secretion and phage assembly
VAPAAANNQRIPTGPGGLFYGVYPATVADITDPDDQGRVQIRLPWAPDPSGGSYEVWARLATLMAGGNRGTWFIPDVGDEVLVAFEAGDPSRPYVVGSLWNGQDSPPEQMDGSGENNLKTILSRQGVRMTMDDTDGAVQLRLETPGGQKITLSDQDSSLVVEDATGNSIRLETSGITIDAVTKVTISASAEVEIRAGMVTVNSGFSQFSGVVQCSTLISNSVVSASYTPGAGNVW